MHIGYKLALLPNMFKNYLNVKINTMLILVKLSRMYFPACFNTDFGLFYLCELACTFQHGIGSSSPKFSCNDFILFAVLLLVDCINEVELMIKVDEQCFG